LIKVDKLVAGASLRVLRVSGVLLVNFYLMLADCLQILPANGKQGMVPEVTFQANKKQRKMRPRNATNIKAEH
jgi:hypothetical protein